MSKTREEMEAYLLEFLEKSKKELEEGLEDLNKAKDNKEQKGIEVDEEHKILKAEVHDIKSGKMIRDTGDTDPKLKSAPQGKLKIAPEGSNNRKTYNDHVGGKISGSTELKIGGKTAHPDKGIAHHANAKLNKTELYDALIKDGQTESALMLRNWDELDYTAEQFAKGMGFNLKGGISGSAFKDKMKNKIESEERAVDAKVPAKDVKIVSDKNADKAADKAARKETK